MRVLVIGGTGFIGPPVVRRLVAQRHEVGVFHRGTSAVPLPGGVIHLTGNRHQLDAHRRALADFAPDVVIDVILSSGTQANALRRVFAGVARRVVALSSMDVYRSTAVFHGLEPGPLEPLPLREESPLRRQRHTYPPETLARIKNVFGWLDDGYEKIDVEREVLHESPFDAVVLRLPMAYGPGDPLRRFAPLVAQMERGLNEIPFEAEVAQWRSTRGFVDDLALAIVLAATAARVPSRIYNVGEADAPSELEWARLVADVVGWSGRFVVVPGDQAPPELRQAGNLAQHWVADTSRIRRELGYAETRDRAEALRLTLASPAQRVPA